MPETRPRWRGERLIAWLSGLLPDRGTVIQRWRAQFGLHSLAVEDLLAHVGQDVAGGAQFVRPDRLEAISALRWDRFSMQTNLGPDWIHDELTLMSKRIPDELATICDADNLRNPTRTLKAPLGENDLRDRCGCLRQH